MHSHEVGRLSKFPFKSRGSILLCGIFLPWVVSSVVRAAPVWIGSCVMSAAMQMP